MKSGASWVGIALLAFAGSTRPWPVPASGSDSFSPPVYTITDLGAGLLAKAINDSGTILVETTNQDSSGHWEGFLIRNGESTSFGTLGSQQLAINNADVIVGDGTTGGFILDGTSRTYLGWVTPLAINRSGLIAGYQGSGANYTEDATTHELPSLGWGYQARAVNDRDQIAGVTQLASGPMHACVWTRTSKGAAFTVTDLGDLGGVRTQANGINDCGLIVGFVDTTAGTTHAVVWEDGVGTDIDDFSGQNSSAEDVNNLGEVVGNMTGRSAESGGSPRAFYWKAGVAVELSPLPGDQRSGAYAINGRGDIVGYSYNTETGVGHAVMWTKSDPVADTTAPTLTCPSDMFVDPASASGAVVTYSTPEASDDIDDCVVPVCTPASGSTFPVGTTTVMVVATDGAGNSSTCSFDVTVGDTTPPVLTLPANLTIEATSASGAVATFTPSATDAVDGAVAVTCSPASASTFAIGTTTVNCSATDAHDNTATGAFTVTVRDTTAPALTGVTASPDELWPCNNKMKTVTISVTTSDAVGVTSCKIVSATSDEAEGGNVDVEIIGDLAVKLRAQRDGGGQGRHYTIVVRCKDAAGNATDVSVVVTVPHDQG